MSVSSLIPLVTALVSTDVKRITRVGAMVSSNGYVLVNVNDGDDLCVDVNVNLGVSVCVDVNVGMNAA